MSGHDHGPEMFDAAFWDARYSSAHSLWSGNPNHQLVTEVGGPPASHRERHWTPAPERAPTPSG